MPSFWRRSWATPVGLIIRPTLGMDIIRDRNPNFVRLSDGSVRNGYTVKLMNHAPVARTFQLEVSGMPVQELRSSACRRTRIPSS